MTRAIVAVGRLLCIAGECIYDRWVEWGHMRGCQGAGADPQTFEVPNSSSSMNT